MEKRLVFVMENFQVMCRRQGRPKLKGIGGKVVEGNGASRQCAFARSGSNMLLDAAGPGMSVSRLFCSGTGSEEQHRKSSLTPLPHHEKPSCGP
ncbi:MAG: hypothetical protein ACRECY_08065 [Phyllobacterium sp.]